MFLTLKYCFLQDKTDISKIKKFLVLKCKFSKITYVYVHRHKISSFKFQFCIILTSFRQAEILFKQKYLKTFSSLWLSCISNKSNLQLPFYTITKQKRKKSYKWFVSSPLLSLVLLLLVTLTTTRSKPLASYSFPLSPVVVSSAVSYQGVTPQVDCLQYPGFFERNLDHFWGHWREQTWHLCMEPFVQIHLIDSNVQTCYLDRAIPFHSSRVI